MSYTLWVQSQASIVAVLDRNLVAVEIVVPAGTADIVVVGIAVEMGFIAAKIGPVEIAVVGILAAAQIVEIVDGILSLLDLYLSVDTYMVDCLNAFVDADNMQVVEILSMFEYFHNNLVVGN